jgi:hypothetical protein
MASGECAGLLTIRNFPKDGGLIEVSQQVWQTLVNIKSFQGNVKLHSDVFKVTTAGGEGQENSPSWYIAHPGDSFKLDDDEVS